MNVKTDHSGGVSIVRVGETRLMYPILSDFSTAVSGLVAAGQKQILKLRGDDFGPRGEMLKRTGAY